MEESSGSCVLWNKSSCYQSRQLMCRSAASEGRAQRHRMTSEQVEGDSDRRTGQDLKVKLTRLSDVLDADMEAAAITPKAFSPS